MKAIVTLAALGIVGMIVWDALDPREDKPLPPPTASPQIVAGQPPPLPRAPVTPVTSPADRSPGLAERTRNVLDDIGALLADYALWREQILSTATNQGNRAAQTVAGSFVCLGDILVCLGMYVVWMIVKMLNRLGG